MAGPGYLVVRPDERLMAYVQTTYWPVGTRPKGVADQSELVLARTSTGQILATRMVPLAQTMIATVGLSADGSVVVSSFRDANYSPLEIVVWRPREDGNAAYMVYGYRSFEVVSDGGWQNLESLESGWDRAGKTFKSPWSNKRWTGAQDVEPISAAAVSRDGKDVAYLSEVNTRASEGMPGVLPDGPVIGVLNLESGKITVVRLPHDVSSAGYRRGSWLDSVAWTADGSTVRALLHVRWKNRGMPSKEFRLFPDTLVSCSVGTGRCAMKPLPDLSPGAETGFDEDGNVVITRPGPGDPDARTLRRLAVVPGKTALAPAGPETSLPPKTGLASAYPGRTTAFVRVWDPDSRCTVLMQHD